MQIKRVWNLVSFDSSGSAINRKLVDHGFEYRMEMVKDSEIAYMVLQEGVTNNTTFDFNKYGQEKLYTRDDLNEDLANGYFSYKFD